MTPGARVQAAIELLDEIRTGAPAERALSGWARRSRFAGSKDRAAVRDHVFQALRCLRSYACMGGAETGRGIMIGALRAVSGDLDGVFSGIGHAPDPLSDAESSAGCLPTVQGDLFDLPDWIIPQFINAMGDESKARSAAKVLQGRAPVSLRVNLRKTTVGQVIEALAAQGVTAEVNLIASAALTVTEGARRVAGTPAYQGGLIELQDGASQAAMEMLEIAPGARVLDYCAGGGGKVLALAARHEARWFAHDAAPQRMKDLPERAGRAGINVNLVDGSALQGQTFDLALCDVPCSGSGTWRRNPDAKWRLTAADLESLNEIQAQILDRASRLTASGGRLAYATCSVLDCENEARIAAFTGQNPEWRVEFQRRWPISENGDGFFLAQLLRA